MREPTSELAPIRHWQVYDERPSLRDILVVFFRHFRMIRWTFAASFLASLLYIASLPDVYEAQAQFMITRDRVDPVVSAGTAAVAQRPSAVSVEELNSEIQLLRSRDLLGRLAALQEFEFVTIKDSIPGRLVGGVRAFLQGEPTEEAVSERRILQLQRQLQITRIRDSNTIRVLYSSPEPNRAMAVIETLCTLYLDKHVAVRRPDGAHEFFLEQSQRYEAQLDSNRKALARFNKKFGVVSADSDMQATSSHAAQFDLDLARAIIDLDAAEERAFSLERQLASTAPRMTTELRTSPRLLEETQASMLNLEQKRTALLERFQPAYPDVVEVEKQIEQTRLAIEGLRQSPLEEKATNANPTHQLVESELVSARSQVASLRAKVERLREASEESRERLARLDELAVKQSDLIRNVAIDETNYLTSVQRQEQARLSDALDHERILNVAIAEYPTLPVLPTAPNRLLLTVLGLLTSLLLSIGLAVIRDYSSSTLRTPEEVERYLGVPVIASVPKH